jgi:hypothetical protein
MQEENPQKCRKIVSGILDMSTMSKSLTQSLPTIVANHLKHHSSDGMSLYIFATGTYAYPISAVSREHGFDIALSLHQLRGLPPSNDWQLIYEYAATDGGDVLN